MNDILQGRRVLLVEDESLVLTLVEDMLLDLGADTVETASNLNEGRQAAADGALSLAILDLDLAGQSSYPIADLLRARGVPIVFVSGYGPGGHDEAWRDAPTLAKPFVPDQLTAFVARALCPARTA